MSCAPHTPYPRGCTPGRSFSPSLSRKLPGLVISLILFLLTACQAPPSASPPTGTDIPPTSAPPTVAVHSLTLPTPTDVLAAVSATPETDLETIVRIPSPVPDPLRFVFPSPGPAPVSAWRPPLYPIPWGLTPYDHFYFARAIGADQVNWPLAEYRYGGAFLPDVIHTGVDIPAQRNTPVLAAGPGRVTWAGYGLYLGVKDTSDPYGLAVAIKHDFGYQGDTLFTVYGHLNRVDVLKGQHVNTGDVLGLVGETGKVTGPHLHFEVRVGKNNFFGSRNPELWIAPPQGWGVLAARIKTTSGALLPDYLVTVSSKETGQVWRVNSYNKGRVNSDPYYRENLVLGDLPAGEYDIEIAYVGFAHNLDLQIIPGMVSYFSFQGRVGFSTELPPPPGEEFIPPPGTPSTVP